MQKLLTKCLNELAASKNQRVGTYVQSCTLDELTRDLGAMLESFGLEAPAEPAPPTLEPVRLDVVPLLEAGVEFTLFQESKHTSKETYYLVEVNEENETCTIGWGDKGTHKNAWNRNLYNISRVVELFLEGTWIVKPTK